MKRTPSDCLSRVDEFRSYLEALGDVHACVNFRNEQYRRDGFGPTPAFQGLIAERGGQALAYALYAFDYSADTGSRPVFLHDLFVRSPCRGQGIGEALMQRLTEICKAAGATSMNWLFWHTNESAIRLTNTGRSFGRPRALNADRSVIG
jgi:GNAT superfamily N-acetyltransferase